MFSFPVWCLIFVVSPPTYVWLFCNLIKTTSARPNQSYFYLYLNVQFPFAWYAVKYLQSVQSSAYIVLRSCEKSQNLSIVERFWATLRREYQVTYVLCVFVFINSPPFYFILPRFRKIGSNSFISIAQNHNLRKNFHAKLV